MTKEELIVALIITGVKNKHVKGLAKKGIKKLTRKLKKINRRK
jgi:DNA repair protein RadC